MLDACVQPWFLGQCERPLIVPPQLCRPLRKVLEVPEKLLQSQHFFQGCGSPMHFALVGDSAMVSCSLSLHEMTPPLMMNTDSNWLHDVRTGAAPQKNQYDDELCIRHVMCSRSSSSSLAMPSMTPVNQA
jgi:hypothetical protein